jgi:hypothetical protein
VAWPLRSDEDSTLSTRLGVNLYVDVDAGMIDAGIATERFPASLFGVL